MTRSSKRDIERRLEELETKHESRTQSVELSEEDKEQLDRMMAEALEVLTDEERARLDELGAQMDSEGFTEQSESSGNTGSPDLTPATKEYLDLIFGVAPSRQLDQRMG